MFAGEKRKRYQERERDNKKEVYEEIKEHTGVCVCMMTKGE